MTPMPSVSVACLMLSSSDCNPLGGSYTEPTFLAWALQMRSAAAEQQLVPVELRSQLQRERAHIALAELGSSTSDNHPRAICSALSLLKLLQPLQHTRSY